MFKFTTIKAKLTLSFSLVLAVAAIVGIVGIVGSRMMSAQLAVVVDTDLPRSEHASSLAEAISELETSVVAYLLQSTTSDQAEAHIRSTQSTIALLLDHDDLASLRMPYTRLQTSLGAAIEAHHASSGMYFTFDGHAYALSDFVNLIAVENAHYMKALGDATRFGVFDGILTDPEATLFARWRSGFKTNDAQIEEMLDVYGAAEADVVEYVRDKIVTDPEAAGAQFVRMKSRRVPKLDRALDGLGDTANLRVNSLWSIKGTALDTLREEMGGFIEKARVLQSDANANMSSSLTRANQRGVIAVVTTFIVFLIGIVITIAASVLATRSIGLPLNELASTLTRLVARQYDLTVPHQNRKDEIGKIAVATEAFRESGLERDTLEIARKEALRVERDRVRTEAEEAEKSQVLKDLEAEKSAARAARLTAFQEDLRAVVDTAQKGDFEVRVNTRLADTDLKEFATQMNTLLAVVSEGIGKTSKTLNAYTTGDLNARVEGEFSGIFADLKRDVNATGGKLSELVSAIISSAGGINSVLETIVGGANSLSSRTATQARSLEQTSSAVSEMAASVSENADNARRAKALSDETTSVADKGAGIAIEAVSAIRLVQESAEQISKINSLVDDLSFQTNLLALNASVEAARAGEAGKGFAVVAHEVRTLAQQSKAAADDIGLLVTQTRERIEAGGRMVEATGTSLSDIRKRISSLEDAIGEISSASDVQSRQVTEISQVVSELDGETQSNAQLAGTSEETARDLAFRAEELLTLVSFFTTEAEEKAGSPRAVPRPGRMAAS